MPISVTCRGCRGRYQVKETLAGKKIRCPQCRETVTVPSDEEFDAVKIAENDPDLVGDEDPSAPLRRPPKVKLPKKSEKKRKPKKNFIERISPEWMLAVFLVILTAGTAASLYVFPPAARLLAFLLILGGIGLTVVSQIHCLHASDDDGPMLRLMYRYVPFFALFHILGNWSELKPHSTTWAIGAALMFAGIALERTAKHFDDEFQRQALWRQHEQMFGSNIIPRENNSPPRIDLPPVQLPEPAPRAMTEEERTREAARALVCYKLSEIEDSTTPATAETKFARGDTIYVDIAFQWEKCEVLELNKIGQPIVKYAGSPKDSLYTVKWEQIRIPLK